MIRVVKRSGRIETLDITKIQKYTCEAVEGLQRVSQSELEVDANLQFQDMMTSENIQQTLIKTAVDKIDIDRPDWTFVASRLFLYDLYHKVGRNVGGIKGKAYFHLSKYFERGEQEGRILLGLKEKYDINDLNDYLDPNRDLQFNYLGIRTLYDRYLLKDSQGQPIELPQQLFMGVAMFLAQNEFDCQSWAKKFYDILSKFEVMAATPTLSNARTPRHQLSSCFTKGTKVRTIQGYKDIDKLDIGDSVLTHKNRFRKVYEVFVRDYAKNLISLNINGLLLDLEATEEHPILSFKKENIKCIRKLRHCILNQANNKRCFSLKGEYKENCELLDKKFASKWHKIDELKEGDFVSVSYPKYIGKDTINNKIKLNNDFMLLLGYFLAEGYISKDVNQITFTFGSKEIKYIEETKVLIEKIFDIEPHIKENKDNSTNITVHSKIIALFFLELVGTGFDKKILNNDILFANPDVQKSLLVGVIRGDGCALEEGYQLTMSNEKLIQQLFEISLRCGLSPYMKKDAKKHKFATVKASHLKISSREDKEFVLSVDKNIQNIKFNQTAKSTLRYFWFEDEYFMKIIEKKESYIEEKVYNIEVEDDHSYSVAGVNVHNCYIGSTPDNIEGIFDAYKEMALLSKFGGGIGWDWSQVRGMGSYIDGHKHAAGGIVPFLKIANDVAIAVDQLGCVAKNSFVRVLDNVTTDKYKHNFRREYQEDTLGWDKTKEKRVEMSRIRKHLSHDFKLTGDKRDTEEINIKNIVIKTIPISEVRIGDLVESFNIELSKVQYKKVEAIHELEVKEKNQIKIAFKEGYIITSKWHPMAIKGSNGYFYKRSDEIEVGEFGVNHEGKADEIIAIDTNPMISEEYMDLTVQGTNNYFASTDKSDKFYLTHNTRKGAIAVYVEPWHIDIRDFLDLKKNSGEERRRAHDLFPSLWLNDLFMQRVQEDGVWTLFDPYEVRELTDLYGKEFEERYIELESGTADITRDTISAKGLWKEILRSYFETGNPFLTFKDTANKSNPNKHAGIIRSSNLCTEIFQNTSPNYYKIKLTFNDGSVKVLEEEEMITVDNGMTKPAKKITALDSLNGEQIWMVDKELSDGDTAVCNLASINLSKVHTKDDLARVIPTAIRMLDNVIDLNFYPLAKVKKTNEKTRAIGLGVMGEAQMLAESKIEWGSNEHFIKIDEVMESVSYYAIRSSSDLSIEKGHYPTYDGSDWSKGIFPIDNANKEACKLVERGGLFGYTHDWAELKEKVKQDGMRNGYLMAVAPTSSISILTGTTQAIEPVYKRKWFEENLSGLIPVVAPNLSADTWAYYTPSYDLNQNVLIKAGAIRQKWIDQGQSLNIFISLDKASGKYLNEIYMNAWKYGLKSTYYLRSQSPEASNDIEDRSQECVGCQ